MAREIHDTLAQGLAAISMRLELARNTSDGDRAGIAHHLESAHRLTRDTLAEARTSIWNMRSQVLEDNDLAGALEGVLRQFADGTPVVATFHVTGERKRLSPVIENELLRIGQEAIANALKHAAARHLDVGLTFADKQVELVVTDDGVGFEPERTAPRAGSYGLVGMRERAAQLGAKLVLTSAPNQGTCIVLRVRTPD